MMNLTTVLQKAGRMLWNYRALWIFGTVLALVGAHMIYPGPWPDRENNGQWTKIIITDTATIQIPGLDVTIDLIDPGGARILTPGFSSWGDFRNLVELLDREASINLWPILVEFGVILAASLLLGVVARYLAETALIRMVYETEKTGVRLSVWKGLQRGWSWRGARLFLLDLTVGLLFSLVFLAAFGLAVAPILLAIRSHEIVLITAELGSFGLLVLAAYLWLVASAVLSLVLQTIRRACVLEDQSLIASIRQGLMITKHHLNKIGQIWLVWMGIRLLWFPLGALIVIILIPVLLLTILAGIFLGGVPAALVGVITGQYIAGVTPWIMGAMAGIPVFVVVMISPLLFLNGLVEVYMSTIWTLTYRDLEAIEDPVKAPAPQVGMMPAGGPAD